MSTGPIDFGEGEIHEVPSTEFGGADGLIQPERGETLKGDPLASGGHNDDALTPSELRGIMARTAGVPLAGVEQRDGISLTGDVVIDPVTGREAPVDRMEDGLGVKTSEFRVGE